MYEKNDLCFSVYFHQNKTTNNKKISLSDKASLCSSLALNSLIFLPQIFEGWLLGLQYMPHHSQHFFPVEYEQVFWFYVNQSSSRVHWYLRLMLMLRWFHSVPAQLKTACLWCSKSSCSKSSYNRELRRYMEAKDSSINQGQNWFLAWVENGMIERNNVVKRTKTTWIHVLTPVSSVTS